MLLCDCKSFIKESYYYNNNNYYYYYVLKSYSHLLTTALICRCVYRRVSGLVGPRPLVARQELLVVEDAFYAGPVWRTGRRAARLHDNAQEPAYPPTRPSGRRRPREFLIGRLQRCRQTLQGVRSVPAAR